MTNILIIAGEASGDTLGAGFVREFQKLQRQTRFFGLGGDKMKTAGVKLSYHIKDLAFLGFWEVVKNIRFIKKVQRDVLYQVDILKPEMAVLIDYPGFNLSLASKLKQRGLKVFYYISPQIWAWGGGRIRKIKSSVDFMTTIFEFEKEVYEKAGVPVRWVGHPLLDEIQAPVAENEFRRIAGLKEDDIALGLFPGSRIQEIERILPELLQALDLISSANPLIKGLIGRAPAIDNAVYRNIMTRHNSNARFYEGGNYDLMARARLNLVCSGTATLECAIIGTPMVVVYKTSPPTYWIARSLIKIPYIAMVNVVAGEKIVPELIQGECNARAIAAMSRKYLDDSGFYNDVKNRLARIKSKLGETGAAGRAAMAAVELMSN